MYGERSLFFKIICKTFYHNTVIFQSLEFLFFRMNDYMMLLPDPAVSAGDWFLQQSTSTISKIFAISFVIHDRKLGKSRGNINQCILFPLETKCNVLDSF